MEGEFLESLRIANTSANCAYLVEAEIQIFELLDLENGGRNFLNIGMENMQNLQVQELVQPRVDVGEGVIAQVYLHKGDVFPPVVAGEAVGVESVDLVRELAQLAVVQPEHPLLFRFLVSRLDSSAWVWYFNFYHRILNLIFYFSIFWLLFS